MIVLAMALGFLSGILGYIFIGLGNNRLPFLGQINIGEGTDNNQIFIDRPRNVVVEQDIQLKQVENEVLPTAVSIYYLKQSTNPLNQAYLPTEALGEGVVITADGWLMSVRSAIPALIGNYEIVGYQLKKYKISKFIDDKVTGLVFGKVEAQNLPVAKLNDFSNLRIGQTLVVVSRSNGLILANVEKIGYRFKTSQDIITSSEELNKEIILNVDFGPAFNGSAVVNLKGEIVGIISDGKIIPVDYFKGLISRVLEGKEITRPALGLKYIDLSQVDGLIGWGERGALVYGNPLRSSPSYGKLLDGDIIKKIDDVEINANRSLTELINSYKTGDSPEFLVQRNGQEIVVDIILK